MDPLHITEFRGDGMQMLIPSDVESIWLFKVLWLIREVRLTIISRSIDMITRDMHSVSIESTTPREEQRQQVIEMLGWEPHGNLPVHIDNPSMKILLYNCLGARDDDFTRCIRESHRLHSAEVVAILEPRVQSFSLRNFFNQFGLTRAEFVEAQQQAGGVWLLWNPNRVGITIVESNMQSVAAIISKPDFPAWVSTIVYGSPSTTNREQLWGKLKFLLEQTGHPWTLAGGKLTHCASDDQRPGGSARRRTFSETINQCGLLGLEFNGLGCTWSNNTVMTTNPSTAPNRAQESSGWNMLLQKSIITDLFAIELNNFAMLVNIIGLGTSKTDVMWKRCPGSSGAGGLIRADQGNNVGATASSVAESESQT
ncbi:uncharacterized protein [Coffea arabica]|uniref:Uncharacterized protein n=1 Tax=Coffea arabica TaxID=13443 RepID=A0A6P6UFU4_COFAR